MLAFAAALLAVAFLHTAAGRGGWLRSSLVAAGQSGRMYGGCVWLGAHLPTGWQRAAHSLLQAAGYDDWDPAAWLGLRLALAGLAAAVGGGLAGVSPEGMPPAALALPAFASGWLLPAALVRGTARRRRRRLTQDLPQTLDLLALAVSGGLDLYTALGEAAGLAPSGPLAEEMAAAGRYVALGLPPEQVLERLAGRTGVPALAALSSAVARARWLGAPLEAVLWEQAAAQRLQLQHELEGRLGTLPLRLTLVTLLFFLPPVLLLIVWPSVLRLLGNW